MEQLKLFEIPKHDNEAINAKHQWERAFQNWSNTCGIKGTTCMGVCGYGAMCDWCEDISYARPCVRALNLMCREKGLTLDYEDYDFERIWYM